VKPHLTPEQFVDLAEGVQPESSLPHLAACEACRRQLAGVRALVSDVRAVDVPEPSPLFWDHLSSRVHDAVSEERLRPRSWRERLLQPRVLVPSLAGAMAVALVAVLLPRAPVTSAMPPMPLPPLAPLGAADDPQLSIVAAYGTTLDWDQMRDEVALASAGGSGDAVAAALTVDEQRELQRLLAEEMAQPGALENRS